MARTASPLATGGRPIPPEWIDYNGHMMDGYYAVAFSAATDGLLDYLGLGEAYRVAGECGMYTVESHICYGRSVHARTALRFQSRLLGCDAKRLHAFHEMRDAADDTVTATNELMLLHVRTDGDVARVAPMPPERPAGDRRGQVGRGNWRRPRGTTPPDPVTAGSVDGRNIAFHNPAHKGTRVTG